MEGRPAQDDFDEGVEDVGVDCDDCRRAFVDLPEVPRLHVGDASEELEHNLLRHGDDGQADAAIFDVEVADRLAHVRENGGDDGEEELVRRDAEAIRERSARAQT